MEIYHSGLPSRAVAVYLYLNSRKDKDNRCYPSINTMAQELSLSRSTVKRAINDLEKARFLIREARFRKKGGKSSNLYMLLK